MKEPLQLDPNSEKHLFSGNGLNLSQGSLHGMDSVSIPPTISGLRRFRMYSRTGNALAKGIPRKLWKPMLMPFRGTRLPQRTCMFCLDGSGKVLGCGKAMQSRLDISSQLPLTVGAAASLSS